MKSDSKTLRLFLWLVPLLIGIFLAGITFGFKIYGVPYPGSGGDLMTQGMSGPKNFYIFQNCISNNGHLSYCLKNSLKFGPRNSELINFNLLASIFVSAIWPFLFSFLIYHPKKPTSRFGFPLFLGVLLSLLYYPFLNLSVQMLYLPDLNGIVFLYAPILTVIVLLISFFGAVFLKSKSR